MSLKEVDAKAEQNGLSQLLQGKSAASVSKSLPPGRKFGLIPRKDLCQWSQDVQEDGRERFGSISYIY